MLVLLWNSLPQEARLATCCEILNLLYELVFTSTFTNQFGIHLGI